MIILYNNYKCFFYFKLNYIHSLSRLTDYNVKNIKVLIILIQVALKTMFRLRKDKPDKDLVVKIATIDELKKNGFKEWFEVGNK